MKNLKITIAALGIIGMASACNNERRHVVISEGDDQGSVRIEYSGRTVFSGDSAIARITPNGYAKYKKDDQSMIAESDHNGIITYQINGGAAQTRLNANDKEFLAQAVKVMIKRGHNNN
jgi:hypothetical protein